MRNTILCLCLISFIFAGCSNKKGEKQQAVEAQPQETSKTLSGLDVKAFEKEVNGKKNNLYVMTNGNGMEVCVINYGARIVSILAPDKQGNMKDIVLGFDNITDYTTQKSDFGAAIGRYGNRIAGGKFKLDGTEYQLPKNNGENCLHGGPTGFQYQMFDINQIDPQTLECTYLSPDGDNDFPGNLNVKVTYHLTNDNAIDISYAAETDKPTVINLTNHSYFNLSGNPVNPITDHILYMDCDKFTPTNAALIPTGKIDAVKGTPMDFTVPFIIGERIDDTSYQPIEYAMGYDHNWIFNKPGDIETMACKITSPLSGISLEVYTIEPAVQFYTGNFLDGTQTGKNGVVYQKRAGFCLETQHYPDSPNHPNFPSTVLRPGEKYASRCIYKFTVE